MNRTHAEGLRNQDWETPGALVPMPLLAWLWRRLPAGFGFVPWRARTVRQRAEDRSVCSGFSESVVRLVIRRTGRGRRPSPRRLTDCHWVISRSQACPREMPGGASWARIDRSCFCVWLGARNLAQFLLVTSFVALSSKELSLTKHHDSKCPSFPIHHYVIDRNQPNQSQMGRCCTKCGQEKGEQQYLRTAGYSAPTSHIKRFSKTTFDHLSYLIF